jgi:mannan endo-1,4-beta-mannosidase
LTERKLIFKQRGSDGRVEFNTIMFNKKTFMLLLFCVSFLASFAQGGFVSRKGTRFMLNGRPWYYIGTNYWYGGLLPLQADSVRGIGRLRRELDFLQAHGVRNLRVLAGAEGSGLISGVPRVGPALQPEQGRFDARVLRGLDVLLEEMARRNMKAVIFFSNNWEWSGGFLQYLNWNGRMPDSILRRKLEWDEMRDWVSRFYSCTPCKEDYRRQVAYVLAHVNSRNGKRYVDDPTIMAWELANEPRPMRPAANKDYAEWIRQTAAFVKSKDRNHLVTLGHEGSVGTESLSLFEQVHRDPNVDYSTIHIWPKNWGWMRAGHLEEDMANALDKTAEYIQAHEHAARGIGKPLVIEEFGLPRDSLSFAPAASTVLRDRYYDLVFGQLRRSADSGAVIAGANFWAFSGQARPVAGQTFWKAGDDYLGDPPMEEQGLYGVFDSDTSTWALIDKYVHALPAGPLAAAKDRATKNQLKERMDINRVKNRKPSKKRR